MSSCLCSELTADLLRSTGFQDPVLVSAKASLARTREVRVAAMKGHAYNDYALTLWLLHPRDMISPLHKPIPEDAL